MMSVFKYKEATWTDLLEPTPEEIREVVERYGIDPLVAHELASPSLKHRVESRQHYIYLVLHFPTWKKSHTDQSQEIDFVIGPDFIITTRYEQIDAVDRFSKKIEVDTILEKDFPGHARDLIFFNLLSEIFKGIIDQLDYIDKALGQSQRRMFDGNEKEMVFDLSESSRHLLDFRKITAPYHEALRTLEQVGQKLFGEDFGFSARGIIEELSKGEAILKHQTEYLSELRETNNSLLSTKQNQFLILLAVIALATDVVVGAMLIYLSVHHF
jgi:magnesium transporter